jgi:hypothetical protein
MEAQIFSFSSSPPPHSLTPPLGLSPPQYPLAKNLASASLPTPLFNFVRVGAQLTVRLSAAGREGDQQKQFRAAATAAGGGPSNFRPALVKGTVP